MVDQSKMANINISTILLKRGNTIAANTYVGPLGELLIDTGEKTIRIQDGATPGGMSTLVNTQQLANLAATVANLSITAGAYGNANVAAYLPVYGGTIGTNLINFTNSNAQINSQQTPGVPNTSSITMTANILHDYSGFYAAENAAAQVYSAQDIQFYANTTGPALEWVFGADGNTTLPSTNGRILFPYNENSNAIIDNSQDVGQFFILQNNLADGYQNINLDTDDALVRISSKNAGGYPLRTWSFDWQGQLTFPDATIQSTAYQGPAGQTSFATVANVTTANVALKAYVDNKIGLLANAPAILDTLGQIATAIQTDEANIGTLLTNLTTTNANIVAANSAIVTANTAMKGYVDAVTTAWTANAATQLSQITAANSAISTLQANLGSYYFWNNANAVGLYNSITSANTSIQTISANIGSFYTYANLNYGTSSYANANVTGYLAGNITIGNATATSFRSNNFLYANGVSILTGIGGTYSNSNVASYLLGNITTGNVGLSIGSWLDFRTTDQNWRIGYGLGAYTKTTAQTTIDVVVGQGQAGPDGFSVGQTGGTSIFELVGYTKNAWFANNVTVVGNVTSGNVLASGFFYANGTPFTSSSYGNTQVVAYLVANPQSGTYSNTNVSAYLTSATITTTGNITASNIVTTGALQGGSGTQGIALQPWTGGGSYAALYSTAITPANGNYSILVNGTSTWLNAGSGGSLFFRINNQTAPTAFTINASQATIGSIGTANSSAVNTQTLVVAGGGLGVTGSSYFSNTLGVGGNLILSNTSYVTSTTGSNGNITLDPDGTGQVSVVGSLTATGNITAGNLTTSGTYTVANITTTGAYGNITGANVISANTLQVSNGIFWANGVAWSSSGGTTYSNANIVANLANFVTNISTSANITTTANMIAPNYLFANGVNILSTVTGGGGTYSNTNVSAYLTTATISTTGNITGGNLVTAGNVYGSNFVGNITTGANITASYFITTGAYGNISQVNTISANNYVYANGVSILTGIGGTYSNANVVANLQNYVTNISSTANIATTANIISPNYLFANGVNILSTIAPSSSYSNTNVAAYLTANPISSIANGGSSVAFASSGGNGVVQIGGVSTAIFSQSQLNVTGNIIASANIQAANIIATQYGNSVGTTASYSGNVTAAYFTGNGVGLTGITYNQIGNIYGSSSNVTLQAGSYSWTFDNTGNLVIPTTSNIVYANGTVFSSGTGGGGTTYSNANVVAMLAANTAVFVGNVGVIGNVATGNIQANATAIFLGANTVISNYGSPTFGYSTHIGNNIYFDANGVQRYRNTQTGAADLIVAPGTLNFYATGTAVTANTATGYTGATSLYMALSTSGMSLYNNAGLVSSGPVTIQSASGLVTNQATIAVFNGVGSTINMGGVATTITLGQSTPGTSSNVFVGNTVGTQTGNLTLRARGQYNYLTAFGTAGGYNSPPYNNQTLTGGSGTGMIASYTTAGNGYVTFPITIVNPGTGYKNGDVVTLPGGLGSTAQIWNYNSNYVAQTGQSDLTLTIDGNLILPGGLSLPANSVVTGDFSNSTFNYRTVFRTTTANATTGIYAVPSGTGTGAAWQAANSSNIANTSKIMITTNGSTDVQLVSGINGTGTYLPLSFLTNGSTQMQLGTAGNLLMVTGGNISTTGNVIAGNIVANQYGNSIGTTATYTGNVAAAYFVGNIVNNSGTTNLVGNVATGNLTVTGNLISTGYGFFPGAYSEASTSAGVFVGNTGTGTPSPRIGLYNGVTSQNWQIDNYGGTFRWFTPGVTQMQLDPGGNLTVVNGNATVAGNVTISGNAGVIQSNRTAFRVYGQGGSVGLNANLVASNWTVDYTQGFAGTALNGTTGIFTAPIAGLYSTTLTARTTSNTNSSGIQAVIQQRKAGITSVACMIEWAPNTTFNHATGSTVVKLAQGDQLWVQCLANGGGSGFSFDGNDHWDVTYLG